MMPDLQQKCQDFIADHQLIDGQQKVLVACSGGPDSMVLAWLLHKISRRVALAHCNFQLREEAAGEEELVRAWAEENGITCHVVRFDTRREKQPGESTQMAARRLRYEFFRGLCAEQGYERIATAHHADDQVETLVMSFLRARTGKLLEGIPVRNGPVIRPLLFAGKEEILSFAAAQHIPYALDASNDQNDYDRNRIRNQVLPAMESINPSFRARFLEQYEDQRLQHRLQVEVFWKIVEKVAQPHPEGIVIDFAAFREEFSEELLPLFLTWYLGILDWKMSAAREARKILHAEVGAIWESGDHQLLRDRDRLIIRRLPDEATSWVANVLDFDHVRDRKVTAGKKWVSFRRYESSKPPAHEENTEMHMLDYDKLRFPLRIRPWRQGDKMQPLGMKGHKLLSDIFIDKRFDRFSKEQALVFEDEEGIVLLDGYRVAERVKIGPETKEILRIEIGREGETA